jgi:tripartite-type tricarboxylate transporter receptor subunit TctC
MLRNFLAAVMMAAFSLSALAQASVADWPSKPVRIVVPFSAGGSSDTLGRNIAQQLQNSLKQSFVVENKGGGGGTIGSALVSKSAPDGYTLVVSGIASHVIALAKNKPFDPIADFTHIALMGGPPLVLVAHPSFPANNLQEFVAYAQRAKDGLSWGSSGQGTHAHLIGEVFAKEAKYNQTHISYKGAGPAISDLLGNQIPVAVVTLTAANSFIASGRLKAFAVTATARMADLPNLPTFSELGYPNLVATTWFGVSGPPGMPAALVEKINAEIRKGLKTEAMQKMMANEGIQSQDWDAATFTRFMRSETDRWMPIVQSVQKP